MAQSLRKGGKHVHGKENMVSIERIKSLPGIGIEENNAGISISASMISVHYWTKCRTASA
jgi:hypothetical protein